METYSSVGLDGAMVIWEFKVQTANVLNSVFRKRHVCLKKSCVKILNYPKGWSPDQVGSLLRSSIGS